jgi:hypothetical protein
MELILKNYKEKYPRRRITKENLNGILEIILSITAHYPISNNNCNIKISFPPYKKLVIDTLHLFIQDDYKKSFLSTQEAKDLHSIVEEEVNQYEWEEKLILCFIMHC